MSARRSCRMRNLRKRCSQPKVRSTTQRHRPSLSRDLRRSAIRAAMPRLRSQGRWALEAYARSACSLPGRLRARPASPLTAGIDSTNRIRKRESCTVRPRSGPLGEAHAHLPANGVCSRVCRDRLGFGPCPPPAGAGTLAASTQARSHMIWSCSRSRRRIALWIRCQTPASIHS